MTDAYKPLLGRLANRWFNEVIATDALRLVLDDPRPRSAFLAFVGQAAGVDLSEIRAFERERPMADGRIDLEGVDFQGRPRLVIEAKFGHQMSVEQMTRYLAYQRKELDDAVPGVLLLLVPAGRLGLAREVMSFVRATTAVSRNDGLVPVPVALSWGECLTAMQDSNGQDKAVVGSADADITQLRAVCDTLGGWSSPLEERPEAEHDQYLRVILDKLREKTKDHGPRVVRDADYTSLRYYGVPGRVGSAYSIGLTHRFDAEESIPVWFRVHRLTPNFQEFKRALRRSAYSEQIREASGHIWLPVDVTHELGGPELVDHIAAQVASILHAMSPATTTAG